MKHLGDITLIKGNEAPTVDCIIGGSPCQDLSLAGKRAGLAGARSGLYMEQIRIIKEMRENDRNNGRTGVDIRPRYMVWENVPGAFSTNKGQDFAAVLEEAIRVAEPEAPDVPLPEKGWPTSGCIVGECWSVAWRVLDAQFWGTADKPLPQRRRRIALVADFGGESAPEILFVREGVSGHTQPGEPKRKETPSDATRGVGADDCLGADQYNAVILGDTVSTLGVNCGMSHGRQCVLEPMAYGISSYDSNAMKSPNPNSGIYEAETSRTLDLNGGNPACNQGGIAVVEPLPYTLKIRSGVSVDSMGKAAGKGALIQTDLSATLGVSQDQYLFQPVVYDARGNGDGQTVGTITGDHNNRITDYSSVVLSLDRASFNQGKNAQYDFEVSTKGVDTPLVAKGPSAVCYSVDQGGGKSGVDVREGKAPTLTTTHDGAPAVCYENTYQKTTGPLMANSHPGAYSGQDAYSDMFVVGETIQGINGDKAGTLDSSYYKGCGMRAGVEREVVAVDCRNATEDDVNGALQSNSAHSLNGNNVVRTRYIVRRLTPLECERLQGYPSQLKIDVSKMTKDEYIAYNIIEGNIIVDAEAGKVYRTRGPGGVKLDKPQEMKGSDSNGYLVVKISNGTTKMTCRVHRIIWISRHGIVPDGYCIDHINSNKKDNRVSNLQLLTPQDNSTKAAQDGLYKTGEDNGATKISPDMWDEIAYLHRCEGKTMRQLAEIYGISKSRIQQIVKEVGWTDIGEYTDSTGKKRQTSDAARYKALGNSIALPPWKWVLKRLCACYERDATMASLFDGIGGFPYLWEQLNGKGSCLWASEIEEFPMAVTKVRIGE